MINMFSFEGFCDKSPEKTYYFKSATTGKSIFICRFTLNQNNLRYTKQYVLFLGDIALKAYEKLESGKAYLVNGQLYVFTRIFNLKNVSNLNGEKQKMYLRGLVLLGQEIYLTKSKTCGKSCRETFRDTIEVKETKSHTKRVITDNLEFIAKDQPRERFKKLLARDKLKSHLKKAGIEEFEEEW